MTEPIATIAHPFADLIGLEMISNADGHCSCELTADDRHMNPNGVVHGAVTYALADTAMGAALSGVLARGEICSTIEIKINYFRPAFAGPLRCETRVVHKGRRTGALESEIFDDQKRLLARATGTFMILAAS
ncbi:phenylacetic acid degradation-related protein [gamma proteobacterium NOR5-3]|nr:phenylacetic acid degradation-related protein [gamma proteobacterium NOR5-3]